MMARSGGSAFGNFLGGTMGVLVALVLFVVAVPILICGGCCAGLIGLGTVADHIDDSPQPQPSPTPSATGEDVVPQEPIFDIPSLFGKSIDEVRGVLGTPIDSSPEPTDLQLKVFSQSGLYEWSNSFTKDGLELMVTFNFRNREVVDFFLPGGSKAVLMQRGNLRKGDPACRIDAVKMLKDPSQITGIKVVPTQPSAANKSHGTLPERTTEQKPLPAVERTWTDSTGKHRTIATLVDATEDTVRLKKPDGEIVPLPLATLTRWDQAHARYVGQLKNPTLPVNAFRGEVVTIADGDTITVKVGNHPGKVRLDGIDAPEGGQHGGSAARKALVEKVFEKNVLVEWKEKDRYGRMVGRVYLGDRWINCEMVAEGFAWHYKEYSDSAELAKAEETARAHKTGLWAESSPIAPWDFRRGVRPEPR